MSGVKSCHLHFCLGLNRTTIFTMFCLATNFVMVSTVFMFKATGYTREVDGQNTEDGLLWQLSFNFTNFE